MRRGRARGNLRPLVFSFRVIDKRSEEKDTVVTNGNFIKMKSTKVCGFEYEKQIGKPDRFKN